ncbi:intraflagellar transport protein 74 homolog isoform X1 [Amphibalanus amphitrite]|uniref:intraflagellar transport protein 74 homolog isoform X1 n=2 Tax=Amphibalanus amphitrite TaxID=1232801 RepID=UPI001C927FB3|nr:intraflagellar transport protein 74 homolog isoform X1 [Amphibalanus amphitrite]
MGVLSRYQSKPSSADGQRARPGIIHRLMAQRPSTQARQGTAAGRLATAGQRLATGAQRAAGGGFGGGAEGGRPMTRGGLGLKTGGTGGRNRAVMDKSYFMGVLRTKITEMTTEIRRMAAECDKMGQDQENFVIYDTRAKEKANELSGIQAELADYNTLVEIMNMDSEKQVVDEQTAAMNEKNEKNRKQVDSLYLTRKQKEDEGMQLERDIEKEQAVIDKVFNEMSQKMKEKFAVLKKKTANAEAEIQKIAKLMDDEDLKIRKNMDIINASSMKAEAYSLYNKLEELEAKKAELQEQVDRQETPDEERERLLREVKENNDAIATMDRKVAALCEDISNANDELDDLDDEDEGDDDAPPAATQARQDSVDTEKLMNQISEAKSDEERRVLQTELEIVKLLQSISTGLKSDTDQNADQGLADSEEWQHLNEVEMQVYSEMDSLKNSIKRMKDDAAKFADLDGFKRECQARQAGLHQEHVQLTEKTKEARAECETAENQNKKMQSKLNSDETFSTLAQLERKLATIEGNNFALQETAADRRALGEYEPIRDQAIAVCADINKRLVDLIKNNKIPT